MITRDEVDRLEKLIGQLASVHEEIVALAKKSPNDAVNSFKLNFVNSMILDCNSLLGEDYKPLSQFEIFDADDVPSNSDVTFIIAQYIQAAEKYRSDKIHYHRGDWKYKLPEDEDKDGEGIPTSAPQKLKR